MTGSGTEDGSIPQEKEYGMKKWKNVREKLLFALSGAFALLFFTGMCCVIFGSADAVKCAVPPFLGFCFTFPLWRKNRKRAGEGNGGEK